MIIYVWKWQGQAYQKVKAIDYATSVIWISRYQSYGEFEIYLPSSIELVELFKENVIFTRDSSDTIMILEKFKLTTDEENGDYLILSGRSLESILERRVVSRQTNLIGRLDVCIKKLIDDNVVNPPKEDIERKIPQLKIGSIDITADDFSKQITGESILNAITDICVAYDCGFKITTDDTPNKMSFNMYQGKDRSDTVIFSSRLGNLSKSEFTFDYSSYYNFIYTAGEGEGKDRVIIGYELDTTDLTFEGLDRREYWLDERNCSSNSENPEHNTYYFAMLQNKGKEKCKELQPVVEFTGEVIDNQIYKYRVDYDLGDTVLVENDYGIQAKATITEVTEIEDETGYRIVPTLSEWRTIGVFVPPSFT